MAGRLVISVMVIVTELPFITTEPRDYCKWDHFTPRCGAREVVLMTNASFGRMELSRCIDRNYGYLGCNDDVLVPMDRACSGRRSCNITIPSKMLENFTDCPRDFLRYLQADYKCVQVYTPVPCTISSMTSRTQPLPLPSGWFASYTTKETGCGSTETPWSIEALPGQTINFTLYDFALSSRVGGVSPSNRVVYMTFKENKRTTPGLGARMRIGQIYQSSSNYVEIRVMQTDTSNRHFMVKYEVIGCEDPPQPLFGYVDRKDNSVTIGCHNDGSKWTMECHGHSWSGTYNNCSAPTAVLSIVVILAVAFAIGVLILVTGLLCLRRRRQRNRASRARSSFAPLDARGYKEEMNYKTTSTTFTGYSQPSFTPRTDTSGENDYEYVDDIKPPPPVMDAGSTFGKVKITGHSCAAHGSHATNQYGFDGTVDFHKSRQIPSGSSAFTPQGSGRTAGCPLPQYYELDPRRDQTEKLGPTKSNNQDSNNPSTHVTRAFSEDTTNDVNQRQPNLNFGHYSQ